MRNPKGLGPAITLGSIFVATMVVGGTVLCAIMALGR